MRRALAALLCAFLSLSAAWAQTYRPGFAPGFRSGFQFISGLPTYDFAGGNYPAVTVSRASTGDLAADTSGTYTSFAANTLRRTNAGATIEGAQTNGIVNNSMQGANAGVYPSGWAGTLGGSGLTQTIVGASSQSGLDCFNVQVSGTTSATLSTVLYFGGATSQIASATGRIETLSAFVTVTGGSLANLTGLDLTVREYDSTPAFLRQTLGSLLGATSTLARFSNSATMGASTAGLAVGILARYPNGAAVNYALRVCSPQEERRDNYAVPVAGASTPIRTTGTAATRAADAASITIPAGASKILYTFDDASTQQVSVSPGAYTIPTNLNRAVIARMQVQP